MAELLVDYITSLDGYGAAEGWPGWWGVEGPEYLAWLEDQPEADYTILMGANTYRLMYDLTAGGEPGTMPWRRFRRLARSGEQPHLRRSAGAPRVRPHSARQGPRRRGRRLGVTGDA